MKLLSHNAKWLFAIIFIAGVFSMAMLPRQGTDNVTLVSFEAEVSEGQIDIIWETATELEVFAFRVERCLPSGDLARCQVDMNANYTDISGDIDPKGDDITGREYGWPDADVETGVTYYYRLKVIDTDNSTHLYGPVWGTFGAEPTATAKTVAATATQTPSQTSASTATHTPTAAHTPTATSTPSATPTGPTPTPSLTSTPTQTYTPQTVNTATPSRTVAAPVVTFTPQPTITLTPSETPTPSETSTETLVPTTTLLPLPSITFLWPSETPSATATPKRFTTPTPGQTISPTPDNAPREIPLRTGFLAVVVGALWLLLGIFLFIYLRRVGQ